MIKNSTYSFGKATIILVATLFMVLTGFAQSKKEKLIADASEGKAEFIKTDGKMAGLFSGAYGYVLFPNVGKGAIGVGGASGNGIAYERGAIVGSAKLT